MSTIAPRKKPVQARAMHTVEAILEAASRVLVKLGYAGLTTTKVAAQAGVGVGTLYQYFPSKDAIVLALLEQQMERMEGSIERALESAGSAPLEGKIEALIDGLLAHKAVRPELARALRNQLPRVDGQRVVRAATRRVRARLRAALELHRGELGGLDLDLCATVLSAAVEGTVSSALEHDPAALRRPELRDALVRLARGYLRESGWEPVSSRGSRAASMMPSA